MKKLKLKALELGAKEVLSRAQLKNVLGGSGSGSGGSGSGSGTAEKCCSITCYGTDYVFLGSVSYNSTCGAGGQLLSVCKQFYSNVQYANCSCN